MKKIGIVLSLIIMILTSCNKTISKGSVAGRWKLTESLIDPGDGSGQWTPPARKTTIEFTSGGVIKYDDNKPSANYKILNDSVMEISSASSTVTFRYKLDGNKLFLRPPCIEACGEKYIRMN